MLVLDTATFLFFTRKRFTSFEKWGLWVRNWIYIPCYLVPKCCCCSCFVWLKAVWYLVFPSCEDSNTSQCFFVILNKWAPSVSCWTSFFAIFFSCINQTYHFNSLTIFFQVSSVFMCFFWILVLFYLLSRNAHAEMRVSFYWVSPQRQKSDCIIHGTFPSVGRNKPHWRSTWMAQTFIFAWN